MRLDWIGHVVRMDREGELRNIWEQTGGKQKKGKTQSEMAGMCTEGSTGDKG